MNEYCTVNSQLISDFVIDSNFIRIIASYYH